jgi:DNA-binding transcriptional LysR family regulator
MDLNEVAIYVKVVQTGSFSGAARQLGMPNSTVSAKVSALEKRLGITLIQRTTRKLHVTPAGEAYFKRSVQGLDAIHAAEAEVAAAQGEPQGLLRITGPVELGNGVLPRLISQFTKVYPKVSIEAILTNRKIDLLAEGVDLAIRAGELKDSSLIARKVGDVYFGLYASPAYLKAHGTPKRLKDLAGHQCLQFTPWGKLEWKLVRGKEAHTVPTEARLTINDINLTKMLALNGDGIAYLPTFFCDADIRAKKLVRLLPEWRSEANPMHFVYPAQKFVMPKLSAFIAMALDPLKESLRACEEVGGKSKGRETGK